jgi:hypothetical protein
MGWGGTLRSRAARTHRSCSASCGAGPALADAGWLYVYVYDGLNAFDLGHHVRISAWKRRGRDALVASGDALLARLREHEWPVTRVHLPFEGGRLTVLPEEPS